MRITDVFYLISYVYGSWQDAVPVESNVPPPVPLRRAGNLFSQ